MKAGLYARVSTQDQNTLTMQMEALESYARQRGWEIVIRLEEVGSGAKTRPKREKLLQAARRREIDGELDDLAKLHKDDVLFGIGEPQWQRRSG